jgi:hypothetical protein
MRYCLLMFRPDTYEKARDHVAGVRHDKLLDGQEPQ